MKVVINESVGGFRPSELAILSYIRKKGYFRVTKLDTDKESRPIYYHDPKNPEELLCHRDIVRHDPIFVEIVENLKEFANSDVCQLKIVDIPDGVDYIICESEDGSEWIAEKHRTWN